MLTVNQVRNDDTVFSNTINVEAIRCFYPRHDGRQGTRITFRDGGGFAVLDSFDAVREALTTAHSDTPFVPLSQLKIRYGGVESEPIPTLINPKAVRGFHPRHEGRAGTRLTFDDGGGFVVSEPYDHLLQVLSPHNVVLSTPQVVEPLRLAYDADVEGSELEEESDLLD